MWKEEDTWAFWIRNRKKAKNVGGEGHTWLGKSIVRGKGQAKGHIDEVYEPAV